jgi:transcriptional regulator with XRE-family HTH domain
MSFIDQHVGRASEAAAKLPTRLSVRSVPNAIDRHVGVNLRTERERAGLSEEALSGALGLPVETLRRFEAGEERIDRHTLLAACYALTIEPEQVYRRTGDVLPFPVADRTSLD